MLILNDLGDSLVNVDAVGMIACQKLADGTTAVVAFAPGVQTMLTSGSAERCQRALDAIWKAAKDRDAVCDLRDLLGSRPNLEIRRVVPHANGGKAT